MLAFQPEPTRRLLRFNLQVLDQAAGLVEGFCGARAPAYRDPVGMHLRHVIEHYEALLNPAETGVVDYDRRPRDPRLERDPALARARLHALQRLLALAPDLQQPVAVRVLVGVDGDFALQVPSSIARELVFVASHAVHHYALLRRHCEEQGIALAPVFGRAPATVAHERRHAAPQPTLQESLS
jgi:hypothetical protein